MNFALRVRAIAAWAPERPAVQAGALTLSYGALESLVSRAAGELATRGVRPGDRVALLLPNVAEFVVAYLATLRVGAIATSVSATWPASSVGAALASSTPRLLLTTAALAPRAQGAPACPATIVIDAPSPHAWLASLAVRAPAETVVPRLPLDPAAILFSSGTTGDPKGVTLSHGNVRFNASAKRVHLAMTAADRVLCFVPLTHVFGQNAVLTSALSAGATVLLHERFGEEALVEAVEREGATVMMGAPPAFARALAAGLAPRLRGLRLALSAAAPLDARIAGAWQEATGRAIHIGYGLTECSPFAAHETAPDAPAGAIGRPVNGVLMRTCDPTTGVVLRAGETGEIEIAGPNVMLGYWGRADATQAVRHGDWLRTGDLGFVDDAGRFHFVERLADVVYVSGFKALPTDVERALRQHPGVREAAAFGVPDERAGQRVEAAVVCDDTHPDDGALTAHCAAQLPGWAVPRRFHRVDALPLSPNGKVLRRTLRDALAPGVAVTAASPSSLTST